MSVKAAWGCKKIVLKKSAIFGFIIFFAALKTLAAQGAPAEPTAASSIQSPPNQSQSQVERESPMESSLEELPGLRERAVMMRMVSRIVEENVQVWNSENSRPTIPGRPVGLKLVGENLVVAVQFTPFLRPQGQHILVAQAQVWVNVPGEGMRYHTTMQTIPIQFSEQVYFFPLGSMENNADPNSAGTAQIEIQLVMEPYSGGRRHQANRPGRGEENRPSP